MKIIIFLLFFVAFATITIEAKKMSLTKKHNVKSYLWCAGKCKTTYVKICGVVKKDCCCNVGRCDSSFLKETCPPGKGAIFQRD